MNLSLVVGATGGIGRAAVKTLNEKGIVSRVLVRNKQKAGKYFSGFNNVEIFIGDASNPNDLKRASKDADSLFYCLNIPYTQWKENATKLLTTSLDTAVEKGLRFIFPGNVYLYGHAQYNPVNESHPHLPHTRKGKIRAEMETLIKRYSKERELKYTITRFPDFYGPFVVNGFSERLFKDALEGKKMMWIGAQNLPLEYIFIDDAAKCMIEAAVSEKGINQEFNIPSCGTITNKNYLELISKLGGQSSKYRLLNNDLLFSILGLFSPMIKEVNEMLYLKREELYLDGTKFKNTFGFLPSTGYEEGVKKTFEWVKNFYNAE